MPWRVFNPLWSPLSFFPCSLEPTPARLLPDSPTARVLGKDSNRPWSSPRVTAESFLSHPLAVSVVPLSLLDTLTSFGWSVMTSSWFSSECTGLFLLSTELHPHMNSGCGECLREESSDLFSAQTTFTSSAFNVTLASNSHTDISNQTVPWIPGSWLYLLDTSDNPWTVLQQLASRIYLWWKPSPSG